MRNPWENKKANELFVSWLWTVFRSTGRLWEIRRRCCAIITRHIPRLSERDELTSCLHRKCKLSIFTLTARKCPEPLHHLHERCWLLHSHVPPKYDMIACTSSPSVRCLGSWMPALKAPFSICPVKLVKNVTVYVIRSKISTWDFFLSSFYWRWSCNLKFHLRSANCSCQIWQIFASEEHQSN